MTKLSCLQNFTSLMWRSDGRFRFLFDQIIGRKAGERVEFDVAACNVWQSSKRSLSTKIFKFFRFLKEGFRDKLFHGNFLENRANCTNWKRIANVYEVASFLVWTAEVLSKYTCQRCTRIQLFFIALSFQGLLFSWKGYVYVKSYPFCGVWATFAF